MKTTKGYFKERIQIAASKTKIGLVFKKTCSLPVIV